MVNRSQLLETGRRDAALVPSASELGGKTSASVRQKLGAGRQFNGAKWGYVDAAAPGNGCWCHPAAHVDARRLLQLHMLTHRNDHLPKHGLRMWPVC